MASYWHVIFFSLIGGLFSLIGGALLLSRRRTADLLAEYATPLAAGALIGAVFLDLLKDGLEEAAAGTVLLAALVGIIAFFYAERFLHWFHHHHQDEDSDPAVNLIIAGDVLHNALDGIAIAAAFLVSVPTGIVTTIAVAAHEIPQEIGDFGLLLSKGISRAKVLAINIISALATTVFAVITFWLGSAEQLPVGALLGLSAGFLLYIALSDIIPTIHDKTPKNRLFDIRPLLLLVGVVIVGLSVQIAHRYIDTDHAAHTDCHTMTAHADEGHADTPEDESHAEERACEAEADDH